MKWRGYRQSGNVSKRGGVGMVGGGIGAVVIAVVALMFGINPSDVLPPSAATDRTAPEANDSLVQFTRAVLASTEDAWSEIFSQAGQDYPEPQLGYFTGAVQSACGMGQSAMGPFYCARDQSIYIDLTFYHDLQQRFGAAGDFAQAYVIAHEVGHHVQNVTGNLATGGGNEASVRQELQADCLAGVWAYWAKERQEIVEPGDLDEALGAAAAIGDDRLQQQSQGVIVPESFTHGSSEQRVASFRTGFETGRPGACGL